jgi:holo-[acyl-carrier protein] synthase
MVVGIGNDLLHIERMVKTYERTGGRIALRILGPQEYQVFLARKERNHKRGMAYLCTRFAAKEAFSKAIGLGMHVPMTWQSVQVLNEPSGKPYLIYSGELLSWMNERHWFAEVTITDEQEIVSSVVIVQHAL